MYIDVAYELDVNVDMHTDIYAYIQFVRQMSGVRIYRYGVRTYRYGVRTYRYGVRTYRSGVRTRCISRYAYGYAIWSGYDE